MLCPCIGHSQYYFLITIQQHWLIPHTTSLCYNMHSVTANVTVGETAYQITSLPYPFPSLSDLVYCYILYCEFYYIYRLLYRGLINHNYISISFGMFTLKPWLSMYLIVLEINIVMLLLNRNLYRKQGTFGY